MARVSLPAHKRLVVQCVLLAAATFLAYSSLAHNGFINFDDDTYLTANRVIQAGIHWRTIRWAATTFQAANWHPLTWLVHGLNWQLFGSHPAGHHYVNLLFHVLNGILLFLLLRSATGVAWRSLACAALFSLHPVNVESVAWAAELKNVLSMAFFLLALLAYNWYAANPSIRRYLSVVALFVFGLMAKPQIITLPFVLLLWDFWPLQRLQVPWSRDEPALHPVSTRVLLLEKLPFLLISGADALITIYAQRGGSAVRTLTEYSIWERGQNALVAYARYLLHAILPLHLSPVYSHPGADIPVWLVVTALGLLVGITVLAVVVRKRYLLAGWLWFLGTIVPMIGIVQVGDQAMADRYAYIPFLGLFWMVIWAIAEAARDLRIPPRWLAVPAVVALVCCALLTYRQTQYWRDSETLWRYAVRNSPEDWIAHANLGRALKAADRPDEAIAEFTLTERLHKLPLPEDLLLSQYELRYGHISESAALCREVLEGTADVHLRSLAYVELGLADVRRNDTSSAEQNFVKASNLEPGSSEAATGLGLLAIRNGDFDTAASYLNRAIKIGPTDLEYYLLALSLENTGHRSDALAAYQKAQLLSPDMRDMLQWSHLLLEKNR